MNLNQIKQNKEVNILAEVKSKECLADLFEDNVKKYRPKLYNKNKN